MAERMANLDVCKQSPHKSIAESEDRCKYHGRRCEYRNMKNPEEELIRDRFMTGVRDDKLRAELLRHKKNNGKEFTLTDVKKAKAWEADMLTNTKVLEAKHTEEQGHFSSSGHGPWNSKTSAHNHGNAAVRQDQCRGRNRRRHHDHTWILRREGKTQSQELSGEYARCCVLEPGLEKSFLCRSQNFSGRTRAPFFWSQFLSSWSQSCAKTSITGPQKRSLSLSRAPFAHTSTRASSMT